MAFDLKSLGEYIPKGLARLPTWPVNHNSMNPDEDEDAVKAEDSEVTEPPADQGPIELVNADPEPISSGPKSNLDLINECDNFPHYQINPKAFFAHINTYYALYVKDLPETELGYLLPSVALVFRGLPDWEVNDKERSLTLITGTTEEERTKAVDATARAMKATGHFKVLEKWRDERYPVYGPNGELLLSIERAASPLFGIVTYGSHLTAYMKPAGSASPEDWKIWVARRASQKQTYGGMLDNTVAGGLATGEQPLECMVRESSEEASLPSDLVRKNVRAVGTVSYFHIRDSRAGGETRLLQPECQYVYDLELAEDVIPKPSDEEVEGFELKSIEEVKEQMRNGEFKPNCALVLLDFFIRHGILTPENEPNYIEIVARLHRRLEFPTL